MSLPENQYRIRGFTHDGTPALLTECVGCWHDDQREGQRQTQQFLRERSLEGNLPLTKVPGIWVPYAQMVITGSILLVAVIYFLAEFLAPILFTR